MQQCETLVRPLTSERGSPLQELLDHLTMPIENGSVQRRRGPISTCAHDSAQCALSGELLLAKRPRREHSFTRVSPCWEGCGTRYEHRYPLENTGRSAAACLLLQSSHQPRLLSGRAP